MVAWLLVILLLGVLVYARMQLAESTNLLLEHVREKKQIYLKNLPTRAGRFFPKSFVPLLANINQLIQEHRDSAFHSKESKRQVEATLSSIQEAVLVIDYEHRIVLFNDAAEQIFGLTNEWLGRRVESIITRSRISAIIQEIKAGNVVYKEEVDMILRGRSFWFEASAKQIPHLQNKDEALVLMVFHEITKVKELERMRKEFVANVSHELRTPITIIKGFAETLVDDHDSIDKDTQKKFLTKISSNSKRLYELVEDLLVLSRLESGAEALPEETLPLTNIISEAHSNFEVRMREARVELQCEMGDDVKNMPFHPLRITQIFENLLENALRYAKGLTTVRIVAKAHFSGVKIVFSDDGAGIPANALPHIFERFYRVDKSRSRESGGTGLGLSIVKHIVNYYGGEISAQSELGKGTAITFTIYPRKSPKIAGDLG